MDEARLAELERLAGAATPGPWWYVLKFHSVYASEGDACVTPYDGISSPNGHFIAAARTAVPALVAEIRRLRAALDRCDMVMDTAAILGLPQELPDVYRDSWAAAHQNARTVLGVGRAALEGKG